MGSCRGPQDGRQPRRAPLAAQHGVGRTGSAPHPGTWLGVSPAAGTRGLRQGEAVPVEDPRLLAWKRWRPTAAGGASPEVTMAWKAGPSGERGSRPGPAPGTGRPSKARRSRGRPASVAAVMRMIPLKEGARLMETLQSQSCPGDPGRGRGWARCGWLVGGNPLSGPQLRVVGTWVRVSSLPPSVNQLPVGNGEIRGVSKACCSRSSQRQRTFV